jgi:hypothetical protein
MITAFFLAHSLKDCLNFILLKKQCMLNYSDNIQLVHHEHWAGRQWLLSFAKESMYTVIITVDVTVV